MRLIQATFKLADLSSDLIESWRKFVGEILMTEIKVDLIKEMRDGAALTVEMTQVLLSGECDGAVAVSRMLQVLPLFSKLGNKSSENFQK